MRALSGARAENQVLVRCTLISVCVLAARVSFRCAVKLKRSIQVKECIAQVREGWDKVI